MIHKFFFTPGSKTFDRLLGIWNSIGTHRTTGLVMVVAFLGSLVFTEMNRIGILPQWLQTFFGKSHFEAVTNAFTLLLVVEIISLVFVLPKSVANSLGKQLELLAIIFLRHAFENLGSFGEPIFWERASESIYGMIADLGGALSVFVLIGAYYRIQKHKRITHDELEQSNFIAAKKILAIILLAAFAILAVSNIAAVFGGQASTFFTSFYTLLIFSDILIVLIAVRYTTSFPVLFRNSGFVAATVLIRLSLTAPGYTSVLLGIGATAFAVMVSLSYNIFFTDSGHSAEE
jgi:hypothetical protein